MSDRSKIRRHVVQSITAVGVLGLAATGVALSLPADAHLKAVPPSKQPQPSEDADRPNAEDGLEASLYSRVMRLRGDIAMTNDDLAALGLTQAQAEDVLARLLEWVEANLDAMIRADNSLKDARRAVVALQRRVQTGEAEERAAEEFGDLYQAVADAEAARESLRYQAGANAVASAPENIRAQWEQARENAHLPVDLRHVPGLNDQRLRSLLSTTANDHVGASGMSELLAGLTLSEQDALELIRQGIAEYRLGVAAAEARVLQLPAELAADELGIEGGVTTDR